MAKYTPTQAQSDAMNTRDRSLLVSAAAGSGKTATLTQRIIKILTEENSDTDISDLLIVTFTRPAATELREKISKAVSDALAENPTNPHLARQALLLGSASICTIDSFCLDVVKSNFQSLTLEDGTPLPPDFRLADDSELGALSISLMNRTIEDWYNKKVGDGLSFHRFAENFTAIKNDDDLIRTLLNFAEKTEDFPGAHRFAADCADDLEAAARGDFFESKFGRAVAKATENAVEHYVKVLEDAIDYLTGIPKADTNYIPSIKNDLACLLGVREGLAKKSYADVRATLEGYSAIGLKTLGKSADEMTAFFGKQHGTVKDLIANLYSDYYAAEPEMLADHMRATACCLRLLSDFTADYRGRLAAEKARRRICTFADIKVLAHKLLVNPDKTPSDVALALREKYKAVYIDEYQDVDRMQDEIFAAVARPGTRFMVGDIKQCIYRFRGSEPDIFGEYREKFKPLGVKTDEEGSSIFMSENFRCNEPVIDFVNLVSHRNFAVCGGAVDYKSVDDLKYKKNDGGKTPVKVVLMPPEKDKKDLPDFKIKSREARYLVGEILRLKSEEKKDDGEPIEYGDIAVLVRGAVPAAEVTEAFTQMGIPYTETTKKDFFAYPEVLLLLSFVSVIANPHRDVRLAATMRSPLFGFTMDELVRIRRATDFSHSLFEAVTLYKGNEVLEKKCAAFADEIARLRGRAGNLPVDRLVRELFRDYSLTSLTLPDDPRTPEQIRDNILKFYDHARGFSEQRVGGDLYSFVKFIDDIIDSGTKISSESGSEDGKVTVMTMHKSKGLEFPVVFVYGCGTDFNRRGLTKPLLYSREGGIGMQLMDETGLARVDTPMRHAVAQSMIENETEEEMRLFYVAMTRARERLYLTASVSKTFYESIESNPCPDRYLDRYSVLSARNYFSWLAPFIFSNYSCFESKTLYPSEIPDPEPATVAQSAASNAKAQNADELYRLFSESFDLEYTHRASLSLPAKLSVSKLYPTVLDDDGAAGLDDGSLPELKRKPLFMLDGGEEKVRATAAERGTATHVFLQFCDFENVDRNGVKSELDRLASEKFIPPATAELVNIGQLEEFFESRLYASVKRAKKLYREQRFNLFLPASEFTENAELSAELGGEKLLVQGVIDLVFEDENGDITLCDYKTDYLTREELSDKAAAEKKLRERHAQQLNYYKAAVGQLFGKAPARVCIYSLPLGDTVEL